MRLGDLVINPNDPESLVFQIMGFTGDRVILKIVDLPLTTVLPVKSLVKIASVSAKNPPLQVISGGIKNNKKFVHWQELPFSKRK